MVSQAAWYTFPRIDNFGQLDPQGPYWKPDSNIQLPGFYPVTALLGGTITSLQQTGFGQDVVTLKLDQPLNQEATHTFYEHLSSFAPGEVVGEHVNAGQLIGYNNPPGQVPLGFGLYSGDVYGSGSAWTQLQQDLAPGGAGLLNPTQLLNNAQSGQPMTSTLNNISSSSNSSCPWYCVFMPPGSLMHDQFCSNCSSAPDPTAQAAGQFGIGDVLTGHFWQRVGIYVLGGVLILIGVSKMMK